MEGLNLHRAACQTLWNLGRLDCLQGLESSRCLPLKSTRRRLNTNLLLQLEG